MSTNQGAVCKALENQSPARGFPIWFCVNLLGVESFKYLLEEKILLSVYLYTYLQHMPGLSLGPPPEVGAVTFRCAGADKDRANKRTEALLKAIRDEGMFVVNFYVITGYVYIRLCTNNFRAHLSDIQLFLEAIETKVRIIKLELPLFVC